MSALIGINKNNRGKLALLIRNVKGLITVRDAARILGIPNKAASVILTHFVDNGWLARIKQGVYTEIPIEASIPEAVIEDSWAITEKLFAPCYVGGWSALEYWGLTEQVFTTTLVFTSTKIRNLSPEIKGAKFLLRVVYPENFFGLKVVWRNNGKIQVSDPSRTMVDILSDPGLAGGIRPVMDALKNYLGSKYNNQELLTQYASKLGNKAVFKRLGFLLEYLDSKEEILITACKNNLSAGNAKLDPALGADALVTRWKLFIPENWRKTS